MASLADWERAAGPAWAQADEEASVAYPPHAAGHPESGLARVSAEEPGAAENRAPDREARA